MYGSRSVAREGNLLSGSHAVRPESLLLQTPNLPINPSGAGGGEFSVSKRTISNGSQIRRRVRLALDPHRRGHDVEAKELYDQILRVNPGHPDALHSSAQLRALQGLSAHDIARSAETAFQHRTSVSRQVC